MREPDKAAFVAALTELAATKSSKPLTTEQFGAWWNALRERWTIEAFRRACTELRDNHEFMPNPYHFEQLRKRATLETHGEAWDRARAHARELRVSGGFVQEQPSGDDELDAVVRCIGGYKAIAAATERDLQFMAQRFNEHRESMQDAFAARARFPELAESSGVPSLPRGPRRLLGGAQ